MLCMLSMFSIFCVAADPQVPEPAPVVEDMNTEPDVNGSNGRWRCFAHYFAVTLAQNCCFAMPGRPELAPNDVSDVTIDAEPTETGANGRWRCFAHFFAVT